MTIPTTLDEAVVALEAMLSPSDLKIIDDATNFDDLCGEVHHSLGRRLRNEWGLWHGSELSKHLRQVHGVIHMSHAILVEFCKRRQPTLWALVSAD